MKFSCFFITHSSNYQYYDPDELHRAAVLFRDINRAMWDDRRLVGTVFGVPPSEVLYCRVEVQTSELSRVRRQLHFHYTVTVVTENGINLRECSPPVTLNQFYFERYAQRIAREFGIAELRGYTKVDLDRDKSTVLNYTQKNDGRQAPRRGLPRFIAPPLRRRAEQALGDRREQWPGGRRPEDHSATM